MSKFKVGDELKQIRAGNCRGLIGQIIKIDEADGMRYHCGDKGIFTEDYLEDNFKLISEPHYTKLNPKVGEKYRVVKKSVYSTTAQAGKIYTVTKYHSHDDEQPIQFDNDFWPLKKMFTTEYLELITEPEKGRWIGKGMLEETESAQAWVNATIKQTQDLHQGTPFRRLMMGDWNAEPINKSIIQKTMSFIKRLTQSADDKTLLKARFTDDCGNLTLTGNDALVSLVFAEKKADLVKLAEEVIAEEKE